MTAENVGSAEVTIDADFSTFDDQLKAGLTSAARRAGAEAEKILKRSGNTAGKEFSSGVSKAANSAKTIDSIRASLDKLETAAKRAGDAQLDSAAKVRAAEVALARVKRTTSLVTIDGAEKIIAAEERVAKARRDATRVSNSAQAAEKALAGARSKLAAALSGDQVADSFGRDFAAKLTPAVTKAGNDSGGFFGSAFRQAASRSIGQGLFIGLIGSLAALITSASPLGAVLGGGAAAAVALAAALTQASGAAIALGGVLGSLGLAAATLKVGFSGVGDAMKAQSKAQEELAATGEISAATQEKLDAALAKLAPSARAVVTQLGAMAPAWQKVTQSVQEKLFAGMSTQLAALGNRYLPILTRQLGTAATTLNQTGVGLAKFLTTGARANQVNTIFSGLNGILRTLLAPLTTIAGGFLDLFTASLPFAQQLADALGRVGTQFGAWLTRVSGSAGFQKFMETSMTLASELFRLLGNIGQIIGAVFSAGAATGGNLLTILGNLTDELVRFLQSPVGQEMLASFFDLVAQAGAVLVGVFRTLQPLLSGISAVFSALEAPLQALGTALLPVLQTLFTSIGTTLQQLAPILAQLVVALTPVITALAGGLVGAFQQLLPVILVLVQAFADLVPSLLPVAQILATTLVQAVTALVPLFIQLAPVVLQLAQAFLTVLLPALQQLLPLIPQLVTSVVQVLSAFIQLLPALLPLVPSLTQLGLAIAQLVVAMMPLITTVLSSLASLLVALAPVITRLIGPITGVIASFTSMVTMITRVITFVSRFAVVVQQSFSRAQAAGIAAASALVSGVVGFFSQLPGRAAALMASFASAVKAKLDQVAGFFRSLPGQIVGALSGLSGQLASAGRNAMDGLIGGLTGALGRVREVAGQIAGAITGPVAKFLDIRSPSRVMKRMGNNAVQGLINGIREKIPAVSAAMLNLASALPKQIGPAITKLNTSLNALGKNLPSTIRVRLNRAVATARVGLASIGRAQDALDVKLKGAQERLTELLKNQQQLAQSVAASIVQTGNIAQNQGDTSFRGIVNRLKLAVAQAKQFNTVIAQLTKAGLNKTALQQIVDAGPEAGLAAGKAVLAAGKAGVNQINSLQSQLQTAANKAATTAARAIFGQGVQVAYGIVAGLRRQRAALDATMLRLADVLVARVLRVLRAVKLKGTGTLDIPGFRHGGVVDRDSLIRAGEGNKREAIVPLERPRDRDRVMRQTGLDQVAAGKGTRTKEIHIPINAREASANEIGKIVEAILQRYGFKPVLGLQTAGGAI